MDVRQNSSTSPNIISPYNLLTIHLACLYIKSQARKLDVQAAFTSMIIFRVNFRLKFKQNFSLFKIKLFQVVFQINFKTIYIIIFNDFYVALLLNRTIICTLFSSFLLCFFDFIFFRPEKAKTAC